MTLTKSLLLLTSVILGALICLRFWDLSGYPNGFYVDEASIAYNGYSILMTGEDEHEVAFPTYFKAFGEYKNPLYIYLQIPFFTVFGPSIFSSRLTAACLMLVAAGVLSYLFYGKIASEQNQNVLSKLVIAEVIAIIFLVMPWSFQLGRVSFEIAAFPICFFSMLVCFFKANYLLSQRHKKGELWFLITFIFLGLLFYSYTLGRFLTPILAIVVNLLLFKKTTWKTKIKSAMVLFIMLVPAISWELTNPGTLLGRYNIVADHNTSPLSFIYYYLVNFSPTFLFQAGDLNIRHSIPNYGTMLWSTIPLLIAGFLYIWQYEARENQLFLLLIAIISPVPVALTIPSPHVLRAVGLLCLCSVLIGYGVLYFIKLSHKIMPIVMCCLAIESILFFRYYFIHYNADAAIWFDKSNIEIFQLAVENSPGPYYISDSFYSGNYVSFLFIYAQETGKILREDQIAAINSNEISNWVDTNQPGLLILDAQNCFGKSFNTASVEKIETGQNCLVKTK